MFLWNIIEILTKEIPDDFSQSNYYCLNSLAGNCSALGNIHRKLFLRNENSICRNSISHFKTVKNIFFQSPFKVDLIKAKAHILGISFLSGSCASRLVLMDSVTRKKSPNVYESCPKMISLEKLKILTPLQKCLRMWEIWAN